jgi:hypothetical protein
MNRPRLVMECVCFVFGMSLAVNPGILLGQLSPSSTQTNTTTTTPTPGGGSASSTAPIETTLFAYRALSSDAEAISGEVSAVARANRRKIVIGTATDAASFAQWRAIMGEIAILDQRAVAIHNDLTNNLAYAPQLSLLPASLHVIISHSGSFALGQSAQFLVIVSNDPLAGPANGQIVVSAPALPNGLTLSSTPHGDGWTCQAGTINCSTNVANPPLAPGASTSVIVIPVKVAGNATPGQVTVTVTASGGGSIATTQSDTPTITSPPRGGEHLLIAPLQQATTPTTPTPAPTSPASPFSTALAAIPVFQALTQFIGQAFSVNETLTATQGSMTDLPLMNMVARHLRHDGVEVFEPSVYTPGLLKGADLQGTFLWDALYHLELHRIQLWADIATTSENLNHANFVTLNPTRYSPENVRTALLFAGEAQSYINAAQSLSSNIDSFEASLFGGQAASPSASPSATGNASPTGGATPTGGTTPAGSTTTPANSAQQTAVPLTGTQAVPQTPTSTTLAAGSGGNILPQIIGSDLLARRIWQSTTCAAGDVECLTNGVNFLAVHALESGGSELSKTNFWYGVHIFFSGGAVTTFSLYEARGDVVCSGVAYNYRGYVREKHYEAELHSGPAHDAILNTDFPCPDRAGAEIHVGMSIDDLIRAIGPPDAKDSGSFLYFSRHMKISSKGGWVTKVEKAK